VAKTKEKSRQEKVKITVNTITCYIIKKIVLVSGPRRLETLK